MIFALCLTPILNYSWIAKCLSSQGITSPKPKSPNQVNSCIGDIKCYPKARHLTTPSVKKWSETAFWGLSLIPRLTRHRHVGGESGNEAILGFNSLLKQAVVIPVLVVVKAESKNDHFCTLILWLRLKSVTVQKNCLWPGDHDAKLPTALWMWQNSVVIDFSVDYGEENTVSHTFICCIRGQNPGMLREWE